MDSKTVYKKLISGACIGIFIGIVAGIAIPTALHWKTIVGHKEDLAYALGNKVIETFVTDNSTGINSDESGDTYEVNDNPPHCNSLEDAVLRFHVKANSNSDEDIALKMMVRDEILMEMGDEISAGNDREEVINYLGDNLERIEEIAESVISSYGYSYPVRAYISEDYFPIRQYGDLTMPAGYYKALRVDIGAAEGENFWCLLYPTMCYTVDSEPFITKEGEDKLKETLTEEDYDKLFVKKDLEKGEVKVGFKILEWLGL